MPETPASRRWRAIIAEQLASGQSVRSFAEAHDLRPGTLTWWKGRIRNLDREAPQSSGPHFTALSVADPVANAVLRLNQFEAHVIIEPDTDLVLVRRVLEALA